MPGLKCIGQQDDGPPGEQDAVHDQAGDGETEAGSLARLARATQALADGLDVSSAQREALELGALLHDIGEIRTPEAILRKRGPLAPEERVVVQAHPTTGVEILETVPLLTPALDVVGGHHERYDGSGYPGGLKAEEIPVAARSEERRVGKECRL